MWTWKDTIDRFHQMDTVIHQIVYSAILIDTILFTSFGALNYLLYSQVSPHTNENAVRWATTVIACGGFVINLLLAKSIARQEYIRQWYFRIFPENLPLMPPVGWLNKDIPNVYCIDCLEPNAVIKKADKKLLILKLGEIWPGYCETWIYILFVIALIFSYLAWVTWRL
jgi:hypothetical protein